MGLDTELQTVNYEEHDNMKRTTNLPQSVLRQVLSAAMTRMNTLTNSEIAFAKRIQQCCNCNHLWVQRGETTPRRCPACFSTQWNLPTIRALAKGDDTPALGKAQGGAA
jgi:protein-arginine kinase activator protein McsA